MTSLTRALPSRSQLSACFH